MDDNQFITYVIVCGGLILFGGCMRHDMLYLGRKTIILIIQFLPHRSGLTLGLLSLDTMELEARQLSFPLHMNTHFQESLPTFHRSSCAPARRRRRRRRGA